MWGDGSDREARKGGMKGGMVNGEWREGGREKRSRGVSEAGRDCVVYV